MENLESLHIFSEERILKSKTLVFGKLDGGDSLAEQVFSLLVAYSCEFYVFNMHSEAEGYNRHKLQNYRDFCLIFKSLLLQAVKFFFFLRKHAKAKFFFSYKNICMSKIHI